MIELRECAIAPDNLLLDPNNFRFQDEDGFVIAAEHRFHEDSVQARAFEQLREENLSVLKKSILTNGYIAVERIVVRPYDYAQGKYVVIEGNRRVAAVKWILQDHSAGVEVSPGILQNLAELPCILAPDATQNKMFRECLMGIRHVSGISNWGGYQGAKLIATLRDEHEISPQEISERLGMSVQEVNRRYRAFKVLEQMKEDEEHGEHAKPSLYPIFHEAISQPSVRDWLGWDEKINTFKKDTQREHFYRLITPTVDEETGRETPPELPTREQVRKLRDILSKPEAKRILLDSGSYQDAINVACQEEFARSWATAVSSAIAALQAMAISELRRLTQEDVALLQRLANEVQVLISNYHTLNPSN